MPILAGGSRAGANNSVNSTIVVARRATCKVGPRDAALIEGDVDAPDDLDDAARPPEVVVGLGGKGGADDPLAISHAGRFVESFRSRGRLGRSRSEACCGVGGIGSITRVQPQIHTDENRPQKNGQGGERTEDFVGRAGAARAWRRSRIFRRTSGSARVGFGMGVPADGMRGGP